MDYAGLRSGLLEPALGDVDLTGDPRRFFRHVVPCPRCDGSGTGRVLWDDEWEDGWSCGHCAPWTGHTKDSPIDTDPDGSHLKALGPSIVEAEALAWETAALLEPWGSRPAERIVWRVGTTGTKKIGDHCVPVDIGLLVNDIFFIHLREQLRGCDAGIDISTPGYDRPAPYPDVAFQARKHANWEAAAKAGHRFPERIRHANGVKELGGHPLAGRSFADLPNFYTQVLEIWLTGYALESVKDGTISLYAASAADR